MKMTTFTAATAALVVTLAIALVGVLNFAAATQEVGETAAWQSTKTSHSGDPLKALLVTYPTGQFVQEARQPPTRIANVISAPQVQKIKVYFPTEIRRYGRSVGPIRVAKLKILVQQNGKAGDVQIAQSSGFDAYDNAALSAARRATYLPAMDDGKPVDAQMDYDVSFGLLCDRAAGNPFCDYWKYPTTCAATVCALLLS